MPKIKEYTCPSCSGSFKKDDLAGRKCPHCQASLKPVQNKINGKLYIEYINNTELVYRPPAPLPDLINEDEDYGVLISQPNTDPKVYLKYKTREYTMIYTGPKLAIGWIYCPECQDQKLFQNIVLSGWAEQKHVCRKCKAKVNTLFRK